MLSAIRQDPDTTPPASYRLTGRQIEAVYAVMRLLRDDAGVSADGESILCDACHRLRPAQGKVSYDVRTLCNGCATDYELLRTARSVRDLDHFLGNGLPPATPRSDGTPD